MKQGMFFSWGALLLSTVLAPRAAATDDDPWSELRSLVGSWEGTAAGFGTTSNLTHEWDFVLDGRFLRLRTRSVSARDDGTEDVHEDVGYISNDTDRDTFVLRQFLSEGFVNTYDLDIRKGEGPDIQFAYREAESAGGMRAQMQLRFVSVDEYEMVLELASEGKDFAACQEMHVRRAE